MDGDVSEKVTPSARDFSGEFRFRVAPQVPSSAPIMLLQGEGEDLCESLALPHSAGESFNVNLDSEIKMGMQRRGDAAFSPSLPIGGRGEEALWSAGLPKREGPVAGPAWAFGFKNLDFRSG